MVVPLNVNNRVKTKQLFAVFVYLPGIRFQISQLAIIEMRANDCQCLGRLLYFGSKISLPFEHTINADIDVVSRLDNFQYRQPGSQRFLL